MLKRSPALMMLMELAAMLLVFSLCAAVTLRMFSEARSMAAQSRRLGAAADIAQIAAESYRSDGSAEQAAMQLDLVWETDRYSGAYELDGDYFTVYLHPQGKHLHIAVLFAGSSLYEITVGAV